MLAQQVNLYNFFAAPPTAPTLLTWKRFWLINLIFTALMFLTLLYSLENIHLLRQEKNAMQKRVDVLQKKFYAIKSTYPAFFFMQNAHESIKQLETELLRQEKILETFTNRIYFSQALLAFAKDIATNVWLTEISLQKNNQIEIKGQSLKLTSLQQFLLNLAQEVIFANYGITLKEIINSGKDNERGTLSFDIAIGKKL